MTTAPKLSERLRERIESDHHHELYWSVDPAILKELLSAVDALENVKYYVDEDPQKAHAADCALIARQALERIKKLVE